MLYIHSASNRSFRKSLVFVGSCRPRWQFLSCVKKGTKDTPPTSWFLDFQQKGEHPLRFPTNTSLSAKRGSVTACGYCGGNFPQGISKGNSLRYAFGSFSRKRKGTAGVGCVTPQAEPAPDFASWYTVRFLLYHAE